MPVNKENVRKLVTALRSGRYTQGRDALEIGGKNCCLGVACRVATEHGLPVRVVVRGEGLAVRFDGADAFLPDSVIAWYGFSNGNPMLIADGTPTSASLVNDKLEFNFNQIADAFERTYLYEPSAKTQESATQDTSATSENTAT